MRTAQDILQAASTLLLDEGYVHWTLPELCTWLNFGLDAITLQKPSASAVTVNVPLSRGTLQTIPAGNVCILRPVRNVDGPSSDRMPRKRITVVDEPSLSAMNPAWDDERTCRYQQQVKHVLFDEAAPKSFYVYPGNDGTGLVEMVLSAIPAKVKPTGHEDDLASYDTQLPLDETYHDALVDYVMYRAYSKDAQFAGTAQRASLHYQQFANSLGIKVVVEARTSPNAKSRVAPAAGGVDQGA